MIQQGKFILFDNRLEFKDWLFQQKITRPIKIIQQHHTYIPNYSFFKGNNHFQIVENMEAYHLERGFDQIAQNITTFPDGKIMICRDLNVAPAGIKGANANGICIEHIGNFDKDGDEMTPEHKDCILKVTALLCIKFNLSPNVKNIVYHHWYDLETGKRTDGQGMVKSCPGSNFFRGNSVATASHIFIPLVIDEINNLKGSV